jgi:hypothetical protein
MASDRKFQVAACYGKMPPLSTFFRHFLDAADKHRVLGIHEAHGNPISVIARAAGFGINCTPRA